MKSNKKVGIFGGSFNPIHMGHLIIAEYIREAVNLDKIFFVPVGIPSHRENDLEDKMHRKNMIELAIQGNSYFELCEIEINKEEKSYTIDTLKELILLYPDYEFYEIIGEDSATYIEKWKNYEELLNLTKFYVFKREGYNYMGKYKNIYLLNTPKIEISASMIRDNIKNNKSIKYLVPEKVEEYIYKNNLYRK